MQYEKRIEQSLIAGTTFNNTEISIKLMGAVYNIKSVAKGHLFGSQNQGWTNTICVGIFVNAPTCIDLPTWFIGNHVGSRIVYYLSWCAILVYHATPHKLVTANGISQRNKCQAIIFERIII